MHRAWLALVGAVVCVGVLTAIALGRRDCDADLAGDGHGDAATKVREGMIESADADTHLVRIGCGVLSLRSLAIVVSPDAEIIVGDKIGGFADLDPGHRVRATYEVRSDGLFARRITVGVESLAGNAAADGVEAVTADVLEPGVDAAARRAPPPSTAVAAGIGRDRALPSAPGRRIVDHARQASARSMDRPVVDVEAEPGGLSHREHARIVVPASAAVDAAADDTATSVNPASREPRGDPVRSVIRHRAPIARSEATKAPVEAP